VIENIDNMKFKDYYARFNSETIEVFKISPKTVETQEKIVNTWMTYQVIEANKKIVFVTWILAIATIILSGLTLYLQYFGK